MKSGEFRGDSKIRIRKGIYEKIFGEGPQMGIIQRNSNEEVKVNFLIQQNSEKIQYKCIERIQEIPQENSEEELQVNSEEIFRQQFESEMLHHLAVF